jgi:redox-sensitive bicupin YhaK (pirin superfamily)
LFIGRLDPKGKVSHALREQRHAWVQLIEGDLDLNGKKLSPGDGASLDDEKEIRLESAKGAHFLLFDLN